MSTIPQALKSLARWLPIAVLVGILGGTASAVLLVSLNWATTTREAHHWLIALLPLAGLAVGCLYFYAGSKVEAGNNLILEEIHAEVTDDAHDPQRTIQLRMTPLILLGTFITHLFGGSAGREGTAIQTGASLADQLARPFRLNARQRRILLMAGVSAGFASVFGTPLAGTVFGLEVPLLGAMSYEAILPCLIAAFAGDLTTRAWHVHHTIYRVSATPAMSPLNLLYAALAGVCFGLAAMLFSRLSHAITHTFKRYVAWPPLRPLLGGILVAAVVFASGSTRFIGLGIPTIVEAFSLRQPWYFWLVKVLLTALTIGAGFKGGEVTPLFFIGATLGNALSGVLPLPPSLLAGMGFVAVFGGAANTPLSSTFMAFELFGADAGAYAGIACVFAYLVSGHTGIYRAQRVARTKV